MIDSVPASRQAATLVLFREQPGQLPALLMMERSAQMAFAPGALVFPGGALDAQDHALAEQLATNLPLDEAAARIAAIRETLEESGLAPGLGPVDRFTLMEMRRAMAAGASFGSVVTEAGLSLDLHALIPFARWHPNAADRAVRIYDTRFYIVRHDAGSHEPSVDATENVHLFWASARDVLERCDRGEGRIIFPTRRNLERLAQFDSFDAAADHARAIPVEKVRPWIEQRADGAYLCIPDHLGYPVTAQSLDTAMRG